MKNLLELIWAARRRRPFRGLRRAAASPGSPISCCSSTCAAAGNISIPAFPRTHSTVMVIPGVRSSTTTAMPSSTGTHTHVSPSSTSGWTPSTTGGTPRQQFIHDDDDQNNNNQNVNEQLILHFPNLPQQNVSNNNEGEEHVPTLATTEKQSLVSQYGFQTHRPRPPLNRAIPPIPESRSNESIQSTHSRRQSGNLLQHQTTRIIDENNPIDLQQEEARTSRPNSVLIELGEDKMEDEENIDSLEIGGKKQKKTTKASKLPKFVRMKSRKETEEERRTVEPKVPKSPLLSVAHSVKNRLVRFTQGGKPPRSGMVGGAELPLSRSLEIDRDNKQMTKIPQKTDPLMPKSRSMEEQREIPRRMPVTTLIPSPGIGQRRLPPDEDIEGEEGGRTTIKEMKQVQFAPLPFADDHPEPIPLPELTRQQELPFYVWTPEKVLSPPPLEEEGKIAEKDVLVEVSTNVVPVEVAAAQEMEKAQLEIPMPPPPPPESSLPPSPIELAPQQRSPPKALSLLRKSPQSFPPLGAITYEHEEAPIRPAKSAMSVSFGAADGNEKKEDEGKRQQQPEGKRRVFTTRSLRIVATRVYEASPLMKRRSQSASRNREEMPPPAKRDSSVGKLFRKRHSIPQEAIHQNDLMPPPSTNAKGKKLGKQKSSGNLISVKSIRHLRNEAPLALAESSRVENSPAVEQSPWEVPSTLTTMEKHGRKGSNTITSNVKNNKGGILFDASSRLCRKDKDQKKGGITTKEKKEESNNDAGPTKKTNEKARPQPLTNPTQSSQKSTITNAGGSLRPTKLAQLLASPLPRKKPTQTQTTGGTKGKGLIDDEITDQPMLISTTPLGTAEFRMIDEPGSSSIHAAAASSSNAPLPTQRSSISPSSSAQSSVLLVAEQQQSTGEINVQMVQQRIQSGLKLAESTNSRKRNAQADSRQTDSSDDGAKIKPGVKHSSAIPQFGTSKNETKSKDLKQPDVPVSTGISGQKDEEMPWADESVKSDDGAAILPLSVLSDFRTNLHQLRDTVRRDLEELETLRLQNAVLREQLAERDRIIEHLQRQLRGNDF